MNQENMQLIGDILGDVDRMIKKRTEQLGWHLSLPKIRSR